MNKLSVSSSPHIRSAASTNRIMLDVLIALAPAAIMGCVIFGWRALLVLVSTTAAAVLAEFVFNIIVKKEQTISDLSAAVTGLILGLNLRADAPIWMCVIGSVFAIVVVKCLFGGLGCNFANPAITGRIFLLICFGKALSEGAYPWFSEQAELVTSATPLQALRDLTELPDLLDMLLGFHGGAIGETCAVAIIVGYLYLVLRKVIKFETPLIFVGTVFLLALAAESNIIIATYQALAGGLLFGAVFMATDYVTTPITRTGKMIFAFGCGLITFLIRYFGSYVEGVSFAILVMNIISPYIEKWTQKKALGGKKA